MSDSFNEEFLEDIKNSGSQIDTRDLVKQDPNSGLPMEMMNKEIEQMNKIAQNVVDNIRVDREKSDELYDFMKDLIDINSDKSGDTRTAMAKAVELRMMGTNQMLEILKVKAKLINPNKGSSININLGSYDEKRGSDTNELIDIVESLKREQRT